MSDRKKIVFLTGATGTMGRAGMNEILKSGKNITLRVLARDSKSNHKKLDVLEKSGKIEVIWGDLTNYNDILHGVHGADYILHVGGMVSPLADHFPERTLHVNTVSCKNIVNAVKESGLTESVRLIYIGSVSQMGNRTAPNHWGRIGDPVWRAEFDTYALSKIEAEKIIAESGIDHWVSLRQTGILSPLIVNKGSDPITFHVPLQEVLEWTTDIDSGRLLNAVIDDNIPESFWKRFYNVGSGEDYRLSNYDFMVVMLKAMNCPPPEKIFDTSWFALRNFHGMWYEDSDVLEEYLHFRSGISCDEYFRNFTRNLPFYFGLAKFVPSFFIKMFMRLVASKKPLGTLSWSTSSHPEYLRAFFRSETERKAIPSWDKMDLRRPSEERIRLDHGYDDSKEDKEISFEDVCKAAEFRGGKCLTRDMKKGDISTKLEWECYKGHRFGASARLVLRGGHWCPECIKNPDYSTESRHNRFLEQCYS